jgi:hypothetical protein
VLPVSWTAMGQCGEGGVHQDRVLAHLGQCLVAGGTADDRGQEVREQRGQADDHDRGEDPRDVGEHVAHERRDLRYAESRREHRELIRKTNQNTTLPSIAEAVSPVPDRCRTPDTPARSATLLVTPGG